MSDFLKVTPLKLHSDERGDLFEVLRFKDQGIPGDGYIYCVTIRPGERRGDHYHVEKKEWFTCVAGEIIVVAETPDGEKQKVVVNAANPILLTFDPHVAHAFVNKGTEPAVAVLYGSKQHDPDDTDTFKKPIEYEGV